MGNIAEAGFGDTRLPSEGEEFDEGQGDQYPSLGDGRGHGEKYYGGNNENLDPGEFTYRDGINYRKNTQH